MEFGKLANVDNVNWKIPPPDPLAVNFLRTLDPDHGFKIYYGAPAWAHKEWVGKIYPEKTKAADYLFHYARKFDTIELNTTHYRIPTQEQTHKWTEQTPPGFLFCPKVFQGISHDPKGLTDPALLKTWFDFLHDLEDRRGPSFLQLPPSFGYGAKALLFKFLQQWPHELELAIELRHPSWFREGRILPPLTEYLQSRGIGLVITDVGGRRDVVHTSISADFVLLRFIGNDLHPSDYRRSLHWSERFKSWRDEGLKRLFLFIHEPNDVAVPEMTKFFRSTLEKALNS